MLRNARRPSPGLTTTKKAFFVSVVVAAFFVLLEIVLAVIGVRPVILDEDPYVGFDSYLPVFKLDPNTERWTTAENKLDFFNAQSFSNNKAPGTFRVFTLGGSTTYGRPFEDPTSFSGWLRTYLTAVAPEKNWEVINCGAVSYASYRAANVMEELLEHEPDLFIVYSGNNEFLEQRSYSDVIEQPRALRNASRVLARSRTFALAKKIRRSDAERAKHKYELTGEVDEILNRSSGLDVYVRDDSLRDQIVAHYRFNLKRMAEMARSAGAFMVLVSIPVNERDFPPFKSQFSDGVTDSQKNRIESRLAHAREALRAGEPDRARDDLFEAVKIDPRYAETQYQLGRALYELGALDEAESAFRAAIAEDVCPLRALREMNDVIATTSVAAGIPLVDFQKALRQSVRSSTGSGLFGDEQFLDHVHPTVATHGFLARLLVEQMSALGILELPGDWLERIGSEVATEIEGRVDDEARAHAYKNLSKVLIWAGKTEAAERYVELAAGLAGDDWEVSFNAGLIKMEAGEFEAAISNFVEAIRLEPGAALAYDSLGATYAAVGRIDEAIANGEQAVRLGPTLSTLHNNLSATYLTAGEFDRAVSSARKALEIDPSMAEAFNNLGNVRFTTGEFNDALEDYQKAVTLRPRYAEAWANKGLVLGQLGRTQEAVVALTKAIELDRDSAAAQLGLGKAYMALGRLVDAANAFEALLESDPQNVEAYRWLARSYFADGQGPKGQAALTRGLSAVPESAALHHLQGQILAGQQRFDEAIVHLRRAIEGSASDMHLDVPEDQLHHGLATALLSSGRIEEGVVELNLAAQINPQNPLVQNDLGLVYEGTGRFDRALEFYRRALELAPGLAVAETNIRRVQARREGG